MTAVFATIRRVSFNAATWPRVSWRMLRLTRLPALRLTQKTTRVSYGSDEGAHVEGGVVEGMVEGLEGV